MFSAAGCGKCVTTKAHLKKRGIEFHDVRVDLDRTVEDHLKSYAASEEGGRITLPVVMAYRSDADEVPDIWSDYHPGNIDSLADTGKAIPTP